MNHGSFAELAFEQKMSGQELLPEEPTSPVIPSSRSKFAMLKTRVEILEKGMGELRDKWIQDIEEHLGRDTNVEPMEMEGTLNIQEFDSMELLQDARKMNKMREDSFFNDPKSKFYPHTSQYLLHLPSRQSSISLNSQNLFSGECVVVCGISSSFLDPMEVFDFNCHRWAAHPWNQHNIFIFFVCTADGSAWLSGVSRSGCLLLLEIRRNKLCSNVGWESFQQIFGHHR